MKFPANFAISWLSVLDANSFKILALYKLLRLSSISLYFEELLSFLITESILSLSSPKILFFKGFPNLYEKHLLKFVFFANENFFILIKFYF